MIQLLDRKHSKPSIANLENSERGYFSWGAILFFRLRGGGYFWKIPPSKKREKSEVRFISIQTHLRLLNILLLKFFDLETIWPS